MGVKMIKDLFTLIFGVFIGVVMVILIYCLDMPKQEQVKENMSMRPPKELPADIEYDEIKVQFNLKEVIL